MDMTAKSMFLPGVLEFVSVPSGCCYQLWRYGVLIYTTPTFSSTLELKKHMNAMRVGMNAARREAVLEARRNARTKVA
jgi:hypothetical protein